VHIKNRKRIRSPEEEFTVVANDGPSVEIIEQKAGQNAVEVFRRGSSKNRLFIRCVPEKKEPFLDEISGLCFWEPAVTLPKSILRRYRRDLLKTAVNRLDKNAAEAALKLLTEQKADNGSPESAAQSDGEPAGTVLNDKPAVSVEKSPKSSITESVIHAIKNGMNWIRSWIRPKSVVATVQKQFRILNGKNK
jgi:hypothetical protein